MLVVGKALGELFKDIMALCLDGATYSAIAAALGCSRRDIAKVIVAAKVRTTEL